jgi:hypothetical protein
MQSGIGDGRSQVCTSAFLENSLSHELLLLTTLAIAPNQQLLHFIRPER